MPNRRGILIALAAMTCMIGLGHAQEGLGARMAIDRLGDIQPGTYTASSGPSFILVPYAEKYLLRFASEPEAYVLYVDHGSLGGRILKYDSGETALAVSGWGAVTIYTDAHPDGLPADRTAGAAAPEMSPLTFGEMQKAAADETAHLSYARGLHVAFLCDWNGLATDVALRALTFDAMQNVARGLERFAASAAARTVLLARVNAVQMIAGGHPTISLHGRTLLVTFAPVSGFAGRASSHGIVRGLGQIFALPTAG
jgi:hypothetical protein